MSETFDVAIVGGGVVGASVAFHLTNLGCRKVVLLERDALGSGATSRSSGVVRTHYSVAANVAVARAALSMFERFADLLDDPEAACGLVKCGYLIMAPPGPASQSVRSAVDQTRALGCRARIVDHREALSLHPWLSLDDIDAIGYEADAGYADPYLTTTSFAQAAKRNGAVIRTDTVVTGLIRGGDRIMGVVTGDGSIHADVVLTAVNVWSHIAAGWAGIAIPMGINAHQVFSLAIDRTYGPDLPVLKDLGSRAGLYMRPSSGMLMVGDGGPGIATDDPDTVELAVDVDDILDHAAQAASRMPAFAQARLARSWSGLYDTTPDWNPVLGAVPGLDGIQVAFGFSGHGFKLSPMIGRMLAQSLLHQQPDLPLHPYRMTRFAENEPLVGAYGVGAVS